MQKAIVYLLFLSVYKLEYPSLQTYLRILEIMVFVLSASFFALPKDEFYRQQDWERISTNIFSLISSYPALLLAHSSSTSILHKVSTPVMCWILLMRGKSVGKFLMLHTIEGPRAIGHIFLLAGESPSDTNSLLCKLSQHLNWGNQGVSSTETLPPGHFLIQQQQQKPRPIAL